MTIAQFVQEGKAIDYKPTVDVSAGDVIVMGDLVAIAKLDIPADVLGELAVAGAFDVDKATGVGTGIAFGIKVYWDAANKQVTADDNAGANKYMGKTIATAGDDDDKVRVRLEQ